MIEEAFRSGEHAQLPYRRRGGVHTDTRQNHEAWENDLGTLTLQSQAVQAMIPIDSFRVRAIFDDTAFSELPNPDYKQALIPQVDIYYNTAKSVFSCRRVAISHPPSPPSPGRCRRQPSVTSAREDSRSRRT